MTETETIKQTIARVIALRRDILKVTADLAKIETVAAPEAGELHRRAVALNEFGLAIDNALSSISAKTRSLVLPFAKTISTRAAT
jgi:hypothetical protein